MFATLYHNMGLNAHKDRIFDGSGTPLTMPNHKKIKSSTLRTIV